MNSPASPEQTTTPGPWHWDDRAGHLSREMPKLVGATGIVCDFGDAERYYPTEGTPPNDADAALIAAAPDLLDAAKLGLSIAKSWIDQEMTGTEHTEAMWALGPIRAAIVRASGEKT